MYGESAESVHVNDAYVDTVCVVVAGRRGYYGRITKEYRQRSVVVDPSS
jgi:hypothetical protein